MAPQFYLYEDQSEGCDYTIGCGVRFRLLRNRDGSDPKDLKEAKALAVSESYLGCEEGEDYGPISANPGEAALSSAVIYEVHASHHLDLRSYIRQAQQRADEGQHTETEAAEWTEFERLKKKFGY